MMLMLLLLALVMMEEVQSRGKILYGTAWKKGDTQRLTRTAQQLGFVAFDTANQPKHYEEAQVEAALSDDRVEAAVQSKFTHLNGHNDNIPYDVSGTSIRERVFESFNQSSARFGRRLKSYVLHAPESGGGTGAISTNDIAAWQAIEQLYEEGRVEKIGVSNFDLSQLRALEKSRVAPQIVSNRCTAETGWDRDVREYCASLSRCEYQAFGLLTWSRHVLKDARVVEQSLGEQLTPAQLVILWALQSGLDVLTGPRSTAHMQADLDVWRAFVGGRRLPLSTVELLDGIGGPPVDNGLGGALDATFVSEAPATAEVYWVDEAAGEALRSQGRVAPGASLRVRTFRGHRQANRACCFVVMAVPTDHLAGEAPQSAAVLRRWTCCAEKAERIVFGANAANLSEDRREL